jgi:hypothetical protein
MQKEKTILSMVKKCSQLVIVGVGGILVVDFLTVVGISVLVQDSQKKVRKFLLHELYYLHQTKRLLII